MLSRSRKSKNHLSNKTDKEKSDKIFKNKTVHVSSASYITDAEEEEYIEYVYKPREYFLITRCQFCNQLFDNVRILCNGCNMVFYCSIEHQSDGYNKHKDFCRALAKIAKNRGILEVYGGHIFNNCHKMNFDQFRQLRLLTLKTCEHIMERSLKPFEMEIILFPRICNKPECREWRQSLLEDCKICGQVAHCAAYPDHININHDKWCSAYRIMEKMIVFQEKNGIVTPKFPNKVLSKPPLLLSTMNSILQKLYDSSQYKQSDCLNLTLSQIVSAPFTAWYALRISNFLGKSTLTLHIVGAEYQFEANLLQKWEVFLGHLCPKLLRLIIVFVGPELSIEGGLKRSLQQIRLCDRCNTTNKKIDIELVTGLYHEYYRFEFYKKPDLICLFNPGLHQPNGCCDEDTWRQTLELITSFSCPLLVTSYTEYESVLDFKSLINRSVRSLNVLVPPVINPFASKRPERNLISDEKSVMIYKNFYCFLIT